MEMEKEWKGMFFWYTDWSRKRQRQRQRTRQELVSLLGTLQDRYKDRQFFMPLKVLYPTSARWYIDSHIRMVVGSGTEFTAGLVETMKYMKRKGLPVYCYDEETGNMAPWESVVVHPFPRKGEVYVDDGGRIIKIDQCPVPCPGAHQAYVSYVNIGGMVIDGLMPIRGFMDKVAAGKLVLQSKKPEPRADGWPTAGGRPVPVAE